MDQPTSTALTTADTQTLQGAGFVAADLADLLALRTRYQAWQKLSVLELLNIGHDLLLVYGQKRHGDWGTFCDWMQIHPKWADRVMGWYQATRQYPQLVEAAQSGHIGLTAAQEIGGRLGRLTPGSAADLVTAAVDHDEDVDRDFVIDVIAAHHPAPLRTPKDADLGYEPLSKAVARQQLERMGEWSTLWGEQMDAAGVQWAIVAGAAWYKALMAQVVRPPKLRPGEYEPRAMYEFRTLCMAAAIAYASGQAHNLCPPYRPPGAVPQVGEVVEPTEEELDAIERGAMEAFNRLPSEEQARVNTLLHDYIDVDPATGEILP